MKRIFFALIALFFVSMSFAQKMEVGNNMFGIGIGPERGFSPYVRATFERGMFEVGPGTLTLGLQSGISHGFGDRHTFFSIGPRAAWYYNFGNLKFKNSDKLNAYAASSLGFANYSYDYTYYTYGYYYNSTKVTSRYNDSGFYFSTSLGANYFLKENIAVFVEEEIPFNGFYSTSATLIGFHFWF